MGKRHHHGDGDGALAAQEGMPFNDYTARMLEDIAGVRWLCDTLEHVAGELPNSDTSTRLLTARLAGARRFMTALEIMPRMVRTASAAEVARAHAGGAL